MSDLRVLRGRGQSIHSPVAIAWLRATLIVVLALATAIAFGQASAGTGPANPGESALGWLALAIAGTVGLALLGWWLARALARWLGSPAVADRLAPFRRADGAPIDAWRPVPWVIASGVVLLAYLTFRSGLAASLSLPLALAPSTVEIGLGGVVLLGLLVLLAGLYRAASPLVQAAALYAVDSFVPTLDAESPDGGPGSDAPWASGVPGLPGWDDLTATLTTKPGPTRTTLPAGRPTTSVRVSEATVAARPDDATRPAPSNEATRAARSDDATVLAEPDEATAPAGADDPTLAADAPTRPADGGRG